VPEAVRADEAIDAVALVDGVRIASVLMISSERPIDWHLDVMAASSIARTMSRTWSTPALTDDAHEAVGGVLRVVGLVLGGERHAALAQRALERIERPRPCDAPRRSHRRMSRPRRACRRARTRRVVAPWRMPAHVDQVLPDRADLEA